MSRAEEITSEVRRLVLTCRAMETQLQQSMPKKTHEEVVSKMQATIDGLTGEVEGLKGELQRTTSLNETVSSLGSRMSAENDSISSLTNTVSGLNQVIEAQKSAIGELSKKLSQTTVPLEFFSGAQSKIEEMQTKIQSMVDSSEHASLLAKCEQLQSTINGMVPKNEYLKLQVQLANSVPKETFDSLQSSLSQYVPRERLVASEARVHELEAAMQNYVPRADYEELTSKLGLLTRELSSLTVSLPGEVGRTESQISQETVQSPEPLQTTPLQESQPKPEINEIQSNLSEIKGAEASGVQSFLPVDRAQGFVFANTTMCATTPVEFLQDLEKVPIESIESHSRSGDFERWFKDVLSDDSTADALRNIRENNCTGDELRTKLVSIISPRYKLLAN